MTIMYLKVVNSNVIFIFLQGLTSTFQPLEGSPFWNTKVFHLTWRKTGLT